MFKQKILRVANRVTQLGKRLLDYTDRVWSYESVVMLFLAVVVGTVTGFGIALFRRILDTLFEFNLNRLGGAFPLAILVLPIVGGLLTALWMRFARQPGEIGLGVSGIMEAVALHKGRIGLRGSIARVGGAILTVGFGGSAGPEDPSVQIGATIGSQIAQRLKLANVRVQTLVGCGAAAGVSAAFNAPITGVFFAIEIVLGEFSGASTAWIVLAAVAGAIASQSILGSAPAFDIPRYELRSPSELLLYLILGVLAALVSVLYILMLDRLETWFEAWHAPAWLKPVVGGIGVGVLAYFSSTAIMGPGYQEIGIVLQGKETSALFLFFLVALKLFATPLTIGSGGQGGLFAPSLFLGAMLGAGFGLVAQSFFGASIAPPPAYALVGMGAVLAGAVRAPITGLMLPFEMTQDYRIILPLMFAVVLSTMIAQVLHHESVYTLKLKQRGVKLNKDTPFNLMRALVVRDAMTPFQELTTMRASDPLSILTEAFEVTSHHGFVVLDDAGNLYGVVTLSDVARMFAQNNQAKTISEVATTDVVTVFPDDTLEDAMRHFGMKDVGRLPVVERRQPRRVVGLMRRADIVSAYSNALLDKQQVEDHHERLRMQAVTHTELLEVNLRENDWAAGKRIRELNLPDGCVIVAVRRGESTLVPRGNTQLHVSDRLIALTTPAVSPTLMQILHGTTTG